MYVDILTMTVSVLLTSDYERDTTIKYIFNDKGIHCNSWFFLSFQF